MQQATVLIQLVVVLSQVLVVEADLRLVEQQVQFNLVPAVVSLQVLHHFHIILVLQH